MPRLIVVLVLALLVVGCTRRLGDLTVASNHNIVLSSFDPSTMTATDTEGKHCVGVFLGIPLGLPNIEDAVDDALSKGGGNLMTDVVLRSTFWTAIIWGQQCIKAEGKVWNVQTAQLDRDWLDKLADARRTNRMHIELSDGSAIQGDVVALGLEQLAVRLEDSHEVRWVDRDSVVGMTFMGQH